MPSSRVLFLLAATAAFAAPAVARAQEKELTLYSARHYQTDERLYAHFTEKTGIKVKRVEGSEDELLERIKKEGANGPADVFITVDAARLGQADALGLFAPVRSKLLEGRIPANLRTGTWFAFSTRARVIVYDRTRVKAADVRTYLDLADPKLKGKVCVRSGSHPYNVSLGSALIAHLGEARTQQWANGLVENLARAPKGGDTDQIRAVATGECQVALANSYYVVRLLRSAKAEDQEIMKRVGVAWPDQHGNGTHINVSGGGLLKTAPHRDAAVRFLEYLASDQAQSYFAAGNNEWPVVKTVRVDNPALATLGSFKSDALNVATLVGNAALAQKIFDRAGWR
ncbi:MAG TPA: extracellular solute-binding protein [Anaeromyxobacter sp.]